MHDTFNAEAQASRTYTLEDIAKNGSAGEISSKAAYLCADKTELSTFAAYLVSASSGPGGFWRFKSYLEGVAATLALKDLDTDIYKHCGQPLVGLIRAARMDTKTVETLLSDCAPAKRQAVLDCALRSAAVDGHLDAAALLLGAGAKPQAYDSRAVQNAALKKNMEMTRFLCAQGGDIDAALASCAKDSVKTFTVYLFEKAVMDGTPEDFRRAAGVTSDMAAKKEVLAKALALFKNGEPEALRHFMRGYLAFKRPQERTRALDEGYKAIVAAPITDLLIRSDDPPTTLKSIMVELPVRDRQTLGSILLRELCANNGSPYLIGTVLECGGEAGVFGNLPLSLAVRNGHTELALTLVRDYGANAGEAVLDAQLNGEKAEVLQKLYTFMASCQMQGLSPTGSRMNLKPIQKAP